MGIATIYAKRNLRNIWTENMGLLYPSSEGFSMVRIHNMFNSNFGWV